ncbi:MAG: hypothetical protein R2716_01965 [Microthrixaceae bacterium]
MRGPGFLLRAPFIGVIVDRFDRKRLMVTADLVRAGVYLLLPLVRPFGPDTGELRARGVHP